MERIGAWQVGDRLVNQETGKQGHVYRIDISVLISISGSSVVIGKQASLENQGWILENQARRDKLSAD